MIKNKTIKLFLIFGVIVLSMFGLCSCNTVSSEFFAISEDLIIDLNNYLENTQNEREIPGTSFAIKLNEVKNGKNLMYVKFNDNNYYYACAYYSPNSSNHDLENIDYCCLDEYIWIGYHNEKDIDKYYDGNEFIVSFQINKAIATKDLFSNKEIISNVEHYQLYKPNFNENDYNVTPAINFVEYYIYLVSSYDKNIYCCRDDYNHILITIPCVEIDNELYIMQHLSTTHSNVENYENNLISSFGEYYEELSKIMITDKYSLTDENGSVIQYGLFEIEDIREIVIK